MTSGDLGMLDGRYQLRDQVGSGLMSSVYLADDVFLDRRVAIKVLIPKLAADDQVLVRFRLEAQLAAKLSHQNFLSLYDIVQHDDTIFIVMEYADRPTVAHRLRSDGALSISLARPASLRRSRVL
jgi:eukaryotic-like serine/threonine-protein kinase